jgi:GNAT superfamily N-acetyltransferase
MNTQSSFHLVDADHAHMDQALPALVGLLQACVAGGASIGWPTTPDDTTATAFWRGCMAAALQGERRFWLALADPDDPASVVGSAQLAFAGMPNGRHRADVMKVMVHPRARRQGLAATLMVQAERAARAHGRWLLVLDTLSGSPAERLYTRLGYQRSGCIPDYAELGDGSTGATTVMFKRLGADGQHVRPAAGDSTALRAMLQAAPASLEADAGGDGDRDRGVSAARESDAGLFVLAHEADGTPCGCAALQPLPGRARSGELRHLLATRPGRGTGRLLVRHLEHEALLRGWHELSASVARTDTNTRGFLARLGYGPSESAPSLSDRDDRVCLLRRLD